MFSEFRSEYAACLYECIVHIYTLSVRGYCSRMRTRLYSDIDFTAEKLYFLTHVHVYLYSTMFCDCWWCCVQTEHTLNPERSHI